MRIDAERKEQRLASAAQDLRRRWALSPDEVNDLLGIDTLGGDVRPDEGRREALLRRRPELWAAWEDLCSAIGGTR